MSEDQSPLEITPGSGNVFAGLGLDNAPALMLKAAIVGLIDAILRRRRLTEVQVAELLDLPQPKVLALRNGKLREFSLERLLEIMTKLDRNVEIGFTKAAEEGVARYFVRDEKTRIAVGA